MWVLTEAKLYECGLAVEGLEYQAMPLQEALRINTLMTAQPYAKERLSLSDIQKFSWDEERNTESVEDKQAYNAEMSKRIREEAERLSNESNDGK